MGRTRLRGGNAEDYATTRMPSQHNLQIRETADAKCETREGIRGGTHNAITLLAP